MYMSNIEVNCINKVLSHKYHIYESHVIITSHKSLPNLFSFSDLGNGRKKVAERLHIYESHSFTLLEL